MIWTIYFPAAGQPYTNVSPDQIPGILKKKNGLLWVSLEQPDPAEFSLILRDTFHFHPLAIEDCEKNDFQTPKVDDYGNVLFIIAHAIHPQQDYHDLHSEELNIFLGSNFVVTNYHATQMHPVEFVKSRLNRDDRLHVNGPDFLCHALLDVLVDDYMPIIDGMEEEIEDLEDLVLAKPRPETLERILALKHSILSMRRIIGPQREIMNRLSRDEFPMIDKQSQIYFRDVYDHLVRIQDLSESIRDIVSGAMDIYLNSTSLRLNEIMKALTIVSTIFLPMSFIAGVYGMNFQHFPEITWKYGYLFVWCLFAVIFAGMLLFFKKRGWF